MRLLPHSRAYVCVAVASRANGGASWVFPTPLFDCDFMRDGRISHHDVH